MKKQRLLFLSNMAAPYQVKFCETLQEYFFAEFWFYIHLEKNRPEWWKIPLGDKCRVLSNSFYFPILNYNNFGLLKRIKLYNPDILILGGFFLPGHFILKKWAKKNDKKIIILTERIYLNDSNSVKYYLKYFIKKLNFSLFKDIDFLFAMGEKPYNQFIDQFGFNKDKVIIMQYPQDIDEYLKHNLRFTKSNYTLIFPNRLDESYNPIFALSFFLKALKKYPELKMKMNASGELKSDCFNFIKQNGLSDSVSFLENIKDWSDLSNIYQEADISVFTANESNGPNTLIECMASGMGILLSKNIYNTHSYALHNQNCFRLDLNINDYLEALINYIEEQDLIVNHGKKSKEMVYSRSIKATSELYHKLLN